MKKFIKSNLLDDKGTVHWSKTSKNWFTEKGYTKEYEQILEKTSFLNSPSFQQRLYHILNDINHEIFCLNCNTQHTKFITINKGYNTYCSNKCSSNHTKSRRRDTIIDKYGEYPFCSENSIKKRRETCLQKFGVEFPFQNKEIQDKQTETMLIVYGVENPSQLQEVKDKKINTSLKNWGTENPNQCEEIHNKKIKTVLEKYDVEYFFQTEKFKEAIKDYSFPTHSKGENEVFEFIKTITRSEIQQGNRSILNGKEIDIYIKDKNIAIEYCGLYWHSNKFRSNSYHKEKFNLCENQNIRLITIFEDEWIENKELIKTKLSHILNSNNSKRIFARKCSIKIVNKKEKTEFYNNNHIQGDGISSINIGLYFNNELISCMSFKQRKETIFELDRYATKYNVIGGFNKLLNYFKQNYNWKEIITFADLRWHLGEVYNQSGFKLDKILNPDYSYIINNKRIHKFNFRKSKIQQKFPDLYDENLSESENMKNIGISKIYDCGKLRFKLVKET